MAQQGAAQAHHQRPAKGLAVVDGAAQTGGNIEVVAQDIAQHVELALQGQVHHRAAFLDGNGKAHNTFAQKVRKALILGVPANTAAADGGWFHRATAGFGTGYVGVVIGILQGCVKTQVGVLFHKGQHGFAFANIGAQFGFGHFCADHLLQILQGLDFAVVEAAAFHGGVVGDPDHAAGQGGGTTELIGLFNDQRFQAGGGGDDSTGHTGSAAAHHDKIVFFVPGKRCFGHDCSFRACLR